MVVIDTSVFISYFLADEPFHNISRTWLRTIVRNKTDLIIPTLALAEVGAALARRTGDSQVALRALRHLQRFPQLQIIAIDERIGLLAATLGIDLRLKGADSVFVAVAADLGVALATWDKEVLNRAVNTITVLQPTI